MSADPEAPVAEATPEPAAAPPVNPGPWSADLTAYFGDNPEAIAAADRYMREKVQPRITELESSPARELYKDLQSDADTTMADLVEELWGEDKREAFVALFGEDGAGVPEGATLADAAAAAGDEPPSWAKPLIERDQAARDQELRDAAQQEYQATLAGMREEHTDLSDDDMELIHPFISAAGGDTEVAYAGFQAFKAKFTSAHGAPPVAAPVADPPPPVLGDSGSAAAAPPVEKKYKDINEAMDDFFAERRAQAPPPVI